MNTCLGKSCSCACLSGRFINFYVCPSFPFDFEGGIWNLIALIPNHCLSIYLQ